MTRAVHGRFLKDENCGDISDHLRNHVHLTNCIHLKNHMHRHSPILAERSLVRDLIVLQRSRSLRDPSTSPPSWHSPSVVETLSKKLERDGAMREGRRRSVGIERHRESRRLSGSFAPVGSISSSKVAASEIIRGRDDVGLVSDRSSMGKIREGRGTKGEESSRKSHRSDRTGGLEELLGDGHNSAAVTDLLQRKVEQNGNKGFQKEKHNLQPKTLSEQLNEITLDSDDIQSSDMHLRGRHARQEKASEEPETSIHGQHNEFNRKKRRKFQGARRSRASMGSRNFGDHNELSVASNSLAQGSTRHKQYTDGGEEEDVEMDGTRAPGNGCGIPWNWSRIHHRGKTILDIAGRSLSCGRSDSRLRKGSNMSHGRAGFQMHMTSNCSSSQSKSDAEATPLLVEPPESRESTDRAAWLHDCSGELGIFADHCMKHDIDSDLASEARSDEQQRLTGYHHGRHQSLSQKYTPRTFRDLVGQNLVAQALSNAILKRKVGFLYVFYGPHGTGKTSCARIFARALNCQSMDQPKPCGVCSSCIAHDLGKSRNVREIGSVGNFDFGSIMDLLENMVISQLQSQYRVFIFDDCDTLPPDSWNAISKVIDRAPRRVVFVLISSILDHLPHIIVSRCQKFFFPKLKDADIIYTLQWIATKEDLEIDKDSLKLIASRSDGSLRDAEMTLEQLSLLGQKITVPLVQELVGLISDEKLVDLLDLALSADTVNTVKNLREIMEAGGEPLALMSQLATIITDILAGSYVFTKERRRRKFFRHQILSKDDMEKLRQALKTLSEAEKQLRSSNDKLTWLTAALLQLAPDQQYMLPSSSTETSFNHSPLILNDSTRTRAARKDNGNRNQDLHDGSADDVIGDGGKKHGRMSPQPFNGARKETDEIWLAVLEKIEITALKHFMHQEGKLVSVSFGAAPTVQLTFRSFLSKSKAEKYSGHILQAFEYVLGSPVTIEIRYESKKDVRGANEVLPVLPASENAKRVSNNRIVKVGYNNDLQKDKHVKGIGCKPARLLQSDSRDMATSEIIEIAASPRAAEGNENKDNLNQLRRKGLACNGVEEPSTSHQQSLGPLPDKKKTGEQSQSLVRSKVSLAHVIQQAEGSTQRNGWSRRKAISIAEKLEQENLRLEPRSRSLLCWKASKIACRKLSRWRFKTRRPRSFIKLVPCARCMSAKSPREVAAPCDTRYFQASMNDKAKTGKLLT